MKDYYKQINDGLSRYENYLYPIHSIEWLVNRIDWCWKYRHISETQMHELTDRAMNILNGGYLI